MRILLGILISFIVVDKTSGQVSMINDGVNVFINSNALLYIPGDYTDNSTAENGQIFLKGGELSIEGNINNNAPRNFISNSESSDNGSLIFSGNNDQNINTIVPEFFPNIEIANGAELTVQSKLKVSKNLYMTNGDLNLSGNQLELLVSTGPISSIGRVIGENENNRIYGNQGEIVQNQDLGESTFDVGMGISFTPESGATFIGQSSTVKRVHDSQNSVALGSVNRFYSLDVPETDNIEDLILMYDPHIVEMNAINENELAIYFSNDNGSNWKKIPGLRDVVNNRIVYTGSIELSGTNTNLFTLAEEICTGNQPNTFASNPPINLTPDAVDVCDGNSVSLNASSSYYEWNGPTNKIVNQNVDILNISVSDEGTYTLYERDSRGCDRTQDVEVIVRTRPLPDLFTTNTGGDRVCKGYEMTFTSNGNFVDGQPVANYHWSFGDGTDLDSADPVVSNTYNSEGFYSISLAWTSFYGCRGIPISGTQEILDPPQSSFQMKNDLSERISSECEGLPITFESAVTFDHAGNNYSGNLIHDWFFGDLSSHEGLKPEPGNNGTRTNHIYDYASSGPYTIQLVISPDQGDPFGCEVIEENDLVIYPKPNSGFNLAHFNSGDPIVDEVCQGIEVQFVNVSDIRSGTITSNLWDFGDGMTATSPDPIHEYELYGDINVSLISISENGCISDPSILDLTINPAPIGNIGVNFSEICIGESVDFLNYSILPDGGSMDFTWDFKDGSLSYSPNPTHTFLNSGSFLVSLERTSTSGNCTNNTEVLVKVNDFINADFFMQNVCEDHSVKFFDQSGNGEDVSYVWEFGDGESSIQQNPEHLFLVDFGSDYHKSFPVTLNVTNYSSTSECESTKSKIVTIHRNPELSLDQVILTFSKDTLLSASVGTDALIVPGSEIVWRNSFRDTLSVTDQVMISESGSYDLGVTGPPDTFCEKSLNFVVQLLEPADLGGDQSICEPITLSAEPINSTIPVEKYQWYRDDVLIKSGMEPQIEVVSEGIYKVTVSYSYFGKTAVTSDQVQVTLNETPKLDLDPVYYTCSGTSITIDADIIVDDYRWENPDGEIISTGPGATVDDRGTYVLSIVDGPCHFSTSFDVVFYDKPTSAFLQVNSDFCIGEIVQLESFSTDGELLWEFGDGTYSSLDYVEKVYNHSGNYPVSLTVLNDAGCTNTFTSEVNIHPKPDVEFEVEEDDCQNSIISLTNNSSIAEGSLSYKWDFGNGEFSDDENPLFSYTVSGIYQIQLIAFSNYCSSQLSKPIQIHPIPFIGFSDTSQTCSDQLRMRAPEASSYRWYDPLENLTLSSDSIFTIVENGLVGLEIITNEGCIDYNQTYVKLNTPIEPDLGRSSSVCDSIILDAGNYQEASYVWSTGESSPWIVADQSGLYTVFITDQNGCMGSDEIELTVNNSPVVELGPDQEICQGNILMLDAGSGFDQYLWSNGEVGRFIEVSTENVFEVKVTSDGCEVTDSVRVNIVPVPSVEFVVNDICLGDEASFTNLSSIENNEYLNYLWDFGDGNNSVLKDPVHNYRNSGEYEVNLSVTSLSGCSHETVSLLSVNAVPSPEFFTNDQCSPLTVQFQNRTGTTDPSRTHYKWDFGDGWSSQEDNPEHIYKTSGEYFTRLTAETTDGCSSSITKPVVMYEIPKNPFLDSILTCDDYLILDAQNPGSNYKWYDNSTNQVIEVTESGYYSVNISNEEGCSIDTGVNVIFSNSEKPSLGDDRRACGEVMLEANTEAIVYEWSTGDQTQKITVKESGEYWVTMISRDLCEQSDTVYLTIHSLPEVDLGPDTDYCEGEKVVLGSDDYHLTNWSTGETSSMIEVNSSGIYSVIVTNENECESSDEVALIFHERPKVNLDPEIIACDSLILDVFNPNSSYSWSSGEVTSTLIVYESGSYDVTVTNEASCMSHINTNVLINHSPSVSLGGDQVLCFGESGTLSIDPSIDAINGVVWSNGDFGNQIEIGSEGWYWVEVTSIEGCVSRDSVYVTVRNPLTTGLEDELVLCEEGEFILDTRIGEGSYVWGSTNGVLGEERTLTSNEPGTYWLEITDEYGCQTTDTIRVYETTEKITSSFLLPSEVIVGDRVRFSSLTEPYADIYFWDFGDGSTSTNRNPEYIYTRPGAYEVTLFVDNGTCSDELTKSISVLSNNARFDILESDVFRFIEIIDASIYPNPAMECLNLDLELSHESMVLVSIYDLRGYQVLSYEFYDKERELTFDLLGLREGIYFIQMHVGSRVERMKFVKR